MEQVAFRLGSEEQYRMLFMENLAGGKIELLLPVSVLRRCVIFSVAMMRRNAPAGCPNLVHALNFDVRARRVVRHRPLMDALCIAGREFAN